MFKAIGTVIVLYAITQIMSSSFGAFEKAATATFQAVESAAIASKVQIEEAY